MKNNHLKIHQDHSRWKSDLEMWSQDLKMWDEEAVLLNDTLSFIAEAVKKHKESLMDHLKVLIDHREKLNQHEKDITFLIEGTPLDDKLMESHTHEGQSHEIYKNAHERLMKYHHTLMALSMGLKKALESI